MNNTFFNNLINFPDVNFDLVLFYILHLTSFANRITGWYLGVGEGRVYATGVHSADKNFAFKISMPYKLFTSTSTLVSGVVPSFSSIKLLTTRHYSAAGDSSLVEQDNLKLDPWWVTGFVDGEGCFTCSITENQEIKTGWRVKSGFELTLHARDRPLLEKIKKTLAVGKIYKSGPQSFQLRVETIKEFARVINHLDKFLLITKKRSDFKLFKRIMVLMKSK